MAGNWKEPEFDFSERSDRVTLKLEVGQVVYIPGAALSEILNPEFQFDCTVV